MNLENEDNAEKTMARILIAEPAEGDEFLESLLKPRHELVVVATMNSAVTRLKKDTFDLIIIDLHFDESRMFDLMNVIRAMSKYDEKPIICVASKSTRITQTVIDGMSFTARALGAWMFLDLQKYNQTQDHQDELLRIFERCLTGEARKTTQAARVDLHQRRQEIHKLRLEIEKAQWSPEMDKKVAEMRQDLMALLAEHCELHMETISQQEAIDESRDNKDRVSECVTQTEDKATRTERKQTLDELHHAVSELQIAEREESKKKRAERKQQKDK
jgi:CheY-like chemotaxis protein